MKPWTYGSARDGMSKHHHQYRDDRAYKKCDEIQETEQLEHNPESRAVDQRSHEVDWDDNRGIGSKSCCESFKRPVSTVHEPISKDKGRKRCRRS